MLRLNKNIPTSTLAILAGLLSLALLGSYSTSTYALSTPKETSQQPNIVLIVADDLGYSDLGVFGGEIRTPNLDTLAQAGTIFSNFHAAPTCSPSRSMLLTGTDNHTAGVGAMAESSPPELKARYGYEGRLTHRVATLAERLASAGYATIMTGKWHLGMSKESQPSARGFQQSFALLQGAHHHFGKGGFGPPGSEHIDASYRDDGEPAQLPSDFYSSDFFTTELINKLDKVSDTQPFFAYLAFSAPHAPLHAPKALVEKYKGMYDEGWNALREQRLHKLRALGLIAPETIAHEIIPDADAWVKLSAEAQAIAARKMEVYAAMVDSVDQNVGRLRNYLKQRKRDNNTVYIFMSDNGPAGDTAKLFRVVPGVAEYIAQFDHSFESIGTETSFEFYGPYWAQAASAPFKQHKGYITEGGTRVPAFITLPGQAKKGQISHVFSHVMDIVPTVLALTSTPATLPLAKLAPIKGKSLLPTLNNPEALVYNDNQSVAIEFHQQRSLYQGPWKISFIPKRAGGSGDWQLYNINNDPAERIDVSAAHPQIKTELISAWNDYAKSAQVLLPASTPQ